MSGEAATMPTNATRKQVPRRRPMVPGPDPFSFP